MPVLSPAELWQRTGPLRAIDAELFKLEDRRGAELVLAMTHEETVTFHVAQVVRSYRDLPLILYHFQTKERDEPRPRAGVLRTREFIMKDSYSFDRDAEGLEVSYEQAHRRLRPDLRPHRAEWYRVESDVGMMGGTRRARVHGAVRRRARTTSRSRPGYAANVEVASADAAAGRAAGRARRAARRSTTPGLTTIERSPGTLGVAGRRAAEGLPGRRRSARAACWSSCAATTASTRSSYATRSASAFRPAQRGRGRRAHRPARLHRAGRRAGPVAARRGRRRRRRATSPGANRPDLHLRGVEPRPRLPVRARRRAHASRRATPSTATRSGSSRRSRSATSSSSARATPSRSARRYLDENGQRAARS